LKLDQLRGLPVPFFIFMRLPGFYLFSLIRLVLVVHARKYDLWTVIKESGVVTQQISW
jgi:hypothetical protein